MSNRRDARSWIHAWWPVAAMVALILLESTRWLGANETSGPLRWLWERVFGPVSNHQWGFIHLCIRKSGHFVGYGMLGLTWLRAWRLSLPRMRLLADVALAVFGTAVIASCDELHQHFLPNRGGSPWDVLLDCCGATVFFLLACAIMRFSRLKRKRQLTLDDESNIVV
jgi:VanZ family protein